MPVQLTRRIRDFTDISLSFQVNPVTKDITLLKNERAIQNALKNCIMISTKTVAFAPDFGSVVAESLFELNDVFALDDIKLEIERTIAFNEPRVEVMDVKVDSAMDTTARSGVRKTRENSKLFYENYVRVVVTYKIFNTEYILTPTSTP